MKKYFYLACLWCIITGMLSSCTKENTYIIQSPEGEKELRLTVLEDGNYTMELTDSIVFKASPSTAAGETSFQWKLDTAKVSTDSVYVFKTDRSGQYSLSVTATNTDGEQTRTANITVLPGKYKHGTFILNEGLIGTHGSLIFITPDGEITPNAYQKVNGKYLFPLTEDLFIHDNKIYIISQKGENSSKNDGGLTVLNAETLKEEFRYSFPEGEVFQPTHIAVLDKDEIYLRTADDIKVFHPSDLTVETIEGSEEPNWNTMAVAAGKVFVSHKNNPEIMVIKKGAKSVSHRIQFNDLVSGVIRSSDGKLWVSDNSGTISKVDPETYEIIEAHNLNESNGSATDKTTAASLLHRNPASSQAAAPHITAKGDTLYMSATKTTIYAYVFSMNYVKKMVDAKQYIPDSDDYFNSRNFQAYNTCAVDPESGEVYLNTLRDWGGKRHTNHISIFDFTWKKSDYSSNISITPRLARDYANYTDFPANVYFTYNFLQITE
ncbi:MAG: DUF5074 domain-containing protein [Marinifilaceae bacterium]|nr:DUF5074 domain-containing protein [Marinifilaceae bacterium]